MKEINYIVWTRDAFTASVLALAILVGGFFAFEPSVGRTQASDSDEFTVKQTIVGELAFVTTANNVTMSPNISGITGGTSNGEAVVAVRANNLTGYNMTIQFASTTSMLADVGSSYVSNYAPATPGTPDYTFVTPSGTHGFAYTVEATDLGDEAPIFRDNGAACNAGAANAINTCWYNIATSTTPVTIVDRGSATLSSGATTTIKFRIGVDNNPLPTLASGVYTATTTLTATEN